MIQEKLTYNSAKSEIIMLCNAASAMLIYSMREWFMYVDVWLIKSKCVVVVYVVNMYANHVIITVVTAKMLSLKMYAFIG